MSEQSPKNYFLMQRGWQDDDFFSDAEYSKRDAWVYLIEKATWKKRKFTVGTNVYDLERGQLSCSVRYLAKAWGWSKTKVTNYLKALQNYGMIKVAKKTGQNLITVCNYSKYQISTENSGTDEGQEKDAKKTLEGQQEDAKWDKTKKDKKEKKVNKRDRGASAFSAPSIEDCRQYFIFEKQVTDQSMHAAFFDFYDSKGWKVGNSPMKNWKSAASGWIRRQNSFNSSSAPQQQAPPGKRNLFSEALDRSNPEPDFENMKAVNP